MIKKIAGSVLQWVEFVLLMSPAWVYFVLPPSVINSIEKAWGPVGGLMKGVIIAAVTSFLLAAITALIKKIRANHIRPWSLDGKNNTPDINMKSPANGPQYLQIFGRVIKASFLTHPISYIFNPFFRVVTKVYHTTGDVTLPTPKPLSKLRDDDYNCDFHFAHMVISGKPAEKIKAVEVVEIGKPYSEQNEDLLLALECLKENVKVAV